jgi:predicted transposase YbfD/YdcC
MPPPTVDEQQIYQQAVADVCSGEETRIIDGIQALRRLYDRRLFGFLPKHLGDTRHDVIELVWGKIFVMARERSIKSEGNQLKGLIYKMAKCKAVDDVRKSRPSIDETSPECRGDSDGNPAVEAASIREHSDREAEADRIEAIGEQAARLYSAIQQIAAKAKGCQKEVADEILDCIPSIMDGDEKDPGKLIESPEIFRALKRRGSDITAQQTKRAREEIIKKLRQIMDL